MNSKVFICSVILKNTLKIDVNYALYKDLRKIRRQNDLKGLVPQGRATVNF